MSDPFNFGSYGSSEPGPENRDQRGSQQNSGGGGFGSHGFNQPSSGSGGFGNSFGPADSTVIAPIIGGFGDETPAGSVAVGRPPVVWLYLGLLIAASGAVIAALFAQIALAIPAWVLAGPIAIGCLAAFILQDTKNRSAPIYSVQTFVPWLFRGLLLMAAIGVGLSAWRIAVWVGHL